METRGTRRQSTLRPVQSEDVLAEWGTEHLTKIIAIDSQSDETAETIPSTEGQRTLSEYLAAFFDRLGLAVQTDEHANLTVTIPANPTDLQAPRLALLSHLDTSKGTEAVRSLDVTPAWEGTEVLYTGNEELRVTVDDYPETEPFLTQDLLHGPGTSPIGLDNKLGIAELMTLTRVLLTNPEIEHGELTLVFRPDEEIGRMAAVEGLADLLRERGIEFGYTIDGIQPFEVNVENFNAARARVTLEGREVDGSGAAARRIVMRIAGVKSHGATAKAEGYLNATVVFARALRDLDDKRVMPTDLTSDPAHEVDATVEIVLHGANDAELDELEARVVAAFEAEVAPHEWRGAGVEVVDRADADPAERTTDEARQLAAHLAEFLTSSGPTPLLSEESEGYEGYSNPYLVERTGEGVLVLSYRLRAFDPEELAARADHIRRVCEAGGELPAVIEEQYVNMGPALRRHRELVDWAQDAAAAMGVEARKLPIRGGTGVDPFIERGIPVANLGTGYFAPESEKEFTSRQALGQHVVWLSHLVQVITLK